jgi:thiol-disulfide isomerase/thioredoxin
VDETGFRQLVGANKGKVVVVDFWATWCSPCREEMPQLVGLERKYRSRGLRLVTVSCDDPEQESDARRFLVENRVPGPLYVKRAADDEKFINFIDRKWSGALPALFLYDRKGRMVRSFIGETDMAALEKALQSLL